MKNKETWHGKNDVALFLNPVYIEFLLQRAL